MATPAVSISARASAPGKLILFGEHAVVYGARAVAGALSDLRIHVTVTLSNAADTAGRLRIVIPDITQPLDSGMTFEHDFILSDVRELLHAAWPSAAISDAIVPAAIQPHEALIHALERCAEPCIEAHRRGVLPALFLACAIFRDRLSVHDDSLYGIHVRLHDPTLPVSAGLGSSAAFSVASAAALLHARLLLRGVQRGLFNDAHFPPSNASSASVTSTGGWLMPHADGALEAINGWAYSAEMLFHGAPSGLDNTVSTYGGAISYTRDPATKAVSITRVPHMPPLRIMVTNTKVPKETGKLVAGVRVLHDALPSVIQPIIASINAVSEECMRLINADAAAAAEPLVASLSRLARVNHSLLNALGVGHAALDGVCALSSRHGLTTKLTGAGGGGCALTLLPEDGANDAVATLSAELRGMGYDCFCTALGGAGALIWQEQ